MDDTDRINHCIIYLTSLYATIRAAICLLYDVDPDMIFRLPLVITTGHIIEHINISDIPLANTLHSFDQLLTETYRFARVSPDTFN
jgi:hypothetical protein